MELLQTNKSKIHKHSSFKEQSGFKAPETRPRRRSLVRKKLTTHGTFHGHEIAQVSYHPSQYAQIYKHTGIKRNY